MTDDKEKDIDELLRELQNSVDFFHWDTIQTHVIRKKLIWLLKFVRKERGWKKK